VQCRLCEAGIPLDPKADMHVYESGIIAACYKNYNREEKMGDPCKACSVVTYDLCIGCENFNGMKPVTGTQQKISEICDQIKEILLDKNRKYGDSAIQPKQIFSKADPIEQINVRLDDKISRIMNAQDDDTEDAELDLIGYLILKRVAQSGGNNRHPLFQNSP